MVVPESTVSTQEEIMKKISLATGYYSTNYRAEAVAIKTGAAHIENSTEASSNILFFTDALSVLQALQYWKEK